MRGFRIMTRRSGKLSERVLSFSYPHRVAGVPAISYAVRGGLVGGEGADVDEDRCCRRAR